MVTIKDIARELDLSYSTVSLCLNSSPRVNRDTMRKVKETAARMGYLPNARARAFVTKKSELIGIVVPDISNPFFSAITRAAEAVAFEKQYHVLILNTSRQSDLENRHIRLLSEGKVDGLLVTSVNNRSKYLDSLLEQYLPVVFVNNPYEHANANFVGSDAHQTGYLAAEHLARLGHARISVCGVEHETAFHSGLMAGFRTRLSEQGIQWDASRRIDGEFTIESGYRCGLQVLEDHTDSTAVFAFDDLIALGVMRAFAERGKRIPEDISLIGCDDIFAASLPGVNLTTIRQHTQEMGATAMNILLKQVGSKSHKTEIARQSVTVPAELIERGTTAPPRSQER